MMKPKTLILSFLLLPLFVPAQTASPYSGSWEGKINVGVELRVVFHINADEKGSATATTDSPDQSVYGIKCDSVYFTSKGITILIKVLNANYTGKLVNDTTINGTLTQGVAVPLILYKVDAPSEKIRLQTPKPPFPYESLDVEYDNADRSVHFGATLTVPKPDPNIRYIKVPEYPVAILITGSGQQDRNESILGHKPFWVIADHLSRNGFAVLRVDDRGMGKTTGDLTHATSADFAKDVEAGIDYLRTRKDIDKNKIGLIGHSEGGMIAPMVASGRNDINFIVLLAGPGIPIMDLMLEQNAAILKSQKISDAAIRSFIPLYKKSVTAVVYAGDSVTAVANMTKVMNDWAKKTAPALKLELGLASTRAQQDHITGFVNEGRNPWFNYFLKYDPRPALHKIKCDVLALNGSKDIQVLPLSNLIGIRNALRKSARTSEVKIVPGLNHLFQRCNKCTFEEYGELEESFSPDALKIITDWLTKHVLQGRG